MYSYSKSTINIVKNSVQHDHMKHVRIYRNFIKREIEERGINLSYIPTRSQVVDVFIKATARLGFKVLIGNLEMTSIYSPAFGWGGD